MLRTRARPASLVKEDFVKTYADIVVSGQQVACKWVILACKRHLRDLEEAKKPDSKFYFDNDEANATFAFFEKFSHFEGPLAGQKLKLELWQKFMLGNIFGWKVRKSGLRRFRHAYVEIPRKSGKTLIGALVAIKLLAADGEGGPQVYTAATNKIQAKIAFRAATKLIQRCGDDRLKAAFKITKVPERIEYAAKDGIFEPLSREAGNKDGLNPHGVIADELHAWTTFDLWQVLNSATGARTQSLFFQITTAGVISAGICREQKEDVEAILNQTKEHDEYFGIVYSVDKEDEEGDNWKNPAVWEKANPNYGISVIPEALEADFKIAQNSTKQMADFKVKRLCLWVNAAEAWIDIDVWKENYQPEIKEEDLAGLKCYGGLDLALVTDLSSLVLLFPPGQGKLKHWTMLTKFWCPKDNILKRSSNDRVPYDAWAEDGHIMATPGNVTDFDWLEAAILESAEAYDVCGVGFDRMFSGQLVQRLDAEGVKMIAFGQGFASMSGPSQELERMLMGRELNHMNHPILNWNAENVSVARNPAGDIKPDKTNATKTRIDGIVAAVMSVGIAQQMEEEHDGGEAFFIGYDG